MTQEGHGTGNILLGYDPNTTFFDGIAHFAHWLREQEPLPMAAPSP